MRTSVRTEVFILLQRNIKAKTGLEEAVVNQATVWPESGADRAAASRKNPVLFPAPKKKARQTRRVSFFVNWEFFAFQIIKSKNLREINAVPHCLSGKVSFHPSIQPDNPCWFPAPGQCACTARRYNAESRPLSWNNRFGQCRSAFAS